MKTKISIGVIVFLIAAVLAGNWIFGNKIAKEIDAQLQLKISKNELPVNVSYTEVKVNPLFSKVKISDVSISGFKEKVAFKSKSLRFKIPYKEALRLAESTTFEELKSIQIQFIEPEFADSSSNSEIKFDNVKIDFDGHLTMTDIESIQHNLPNVKQRLTLSFSNLKTNAPKIFNKQSINAEFQKQISNIDKGNFTLIFLPDTKEVQIKDMSLYSKVLSMKNNSVVQYSGNGFADLKVEGAEVNADLFLTPDDIEWEESGSKGTFSLTKLSVSTASEVQIDKEMLPDGKFSLLIEGLKSKYPEGSSKHLFQLPFGAAIDEIDMDKFEINYQLKAGELTINNTELRSSLMDATLEADVAMNQKRPDLSNINAAKLVVEKLSPELENMVRNFEKQMGKTLPRVDNNITLEISGRLMQPKIKGLEL